jgi:YD repeat-containing protein
MGCHVSLIGCLRAVALVAFVLYSRPVSAQVYFTLSRGTDIGGIQALQGYHTFEPFEHLNTNTANLVLSFTDLALPGNAGRELVFQRTYNNKWISSPIDANDTWRWSLGFPGMVMRVIEQAPPGSVVPLTLEGQIALTPVFILADGSRRATVMKPNESGHVVVDAAFRKYVRDTRTLYAPDGTVSQFDAQGHLTTFTDPYGNTVTLDRTTIANAILVTQTLGPQQQHQVRLDLDALGQVTTMTYGSRVWSYEYSGRDLERVVPPAGPDWAFSYLDGYLETITTPGGGTITYGYTSPSGTPSVRHRTGPDVQPGEWLIGFEWADATLARKAEITTPSGARYRYRNYESTAPDRLVLGGGSGYIERTVNNESWVYSDIDERWYAAVGVEPKADASGWFEAGQLYIQTLRHRDPAYPTPEPYHTTVWLYRNGGAEHGGEYHQPYTVSYADGSGMDRSLVRTYQHLQSPSYIVGLPATETEHIVGMGVGTTRTWTYHASTGFLQRATVTAAGTPAEETTFAPTADGRGNVGTVTSPTGKTTTFTYAWGRVASMQPAEPNSGVTSVINPDGTVASQTRGGRTTSYGYDGLFRLTSTQGPGATNPVTIAYHNSTGRGWTTSRGGASVTTTLDGFGSAVETVDSSGVRVRTGYDGAGRVVYRGLPYTPGAQFFHADLGTTVAYDLMNRPWQEVHPDQTTVTRYYEGTKTRVVNARGFTTELTHNGGDQLASLKDADQQVWTYTYHPTGQLHEILGPDTVVRRWEYDGRRRLASETHPESGTLTYEAYDAAGLLLRTRDADGHVTRYSYDGNDRLATVTAVKAGAQAPRITTLAYEPGTDNVAEVSVGATATAPAVTTRFAYDAAGRLEAREDVVDGKTFVSGYTYDANDNLTVVEYPSGRRIGYAYDAHNRLARVYDVDTDATYANGFVYDGSGALRSYTLGNGLTTTVARHPTTHRVSGITSGALQLGYTHDAGGNVETISDSRPNMHQSFTYDALDRLSVATGYYGTAPHHYDAHGNRQASPGGVSYDYDPANRFRLTGIGGVGGYQYAANGNLIAETAGPTATRPTACSTRRRWTPWSRGMRTTARAGASARWSKAASSDMRCAGRAERC